MIDLDNKEVTPEEGILYQRIDNLDLCVRAQNCIKSCNINYVGQLIQRNYEELKAIRNMGRKAMDNITVTLGVAGLSLGMTIMYWDAEDFSSFLERINNPYN